MPVILAISNPSCAGDGSRKITVRPTKVKQTISKIAKAGMGKWLSGYTAYLVSARS
jgi:hypothetical protein